MPTMHPITRVEQAFSHLQLLPRQEQCKVIAQMVCDGSLTHQQDVLYMLCAGEFGLSDQLH
jgi:hypothetical protein